MRYVRQLLVISCCLLPKAISHKMDSAEKVSVPLVSNDDDDVDDPLQEGEDTSGHNAVSTKAQSDALEGLILNINDSLIFMSDALAKITPQAQSGGSTSTNPPIKLGQPPK